MALQGCVINGLESVKDDTSLTSSFVRPDDPQESIGAGEHPLVIAKYGGEYRDPAAERMLAIIVGRLISVTDDPSRIYKVTILDTPKINAFALPGGYLYLTRGLLALANDSSEIAAVIAHEMAHVTANHAILRQERKGASDIGEDVVHNVLNDNVAAKVAQAANEIKLSDFSRDQELQADALGIRVVGRAGFDPYAAGRFLETMQAFQALKTGGPARDEFTFLASHPTTPQRIDLARRHARYFGAPGIGTRDRDRYLDGIDGMLFGDSAAEGFVRGNVFSHAGLGITFQAPEGARIENQPKAIIVSGPGDAATRFDAAVLGSFQDLSAYLKSGWINGLDEQSVTTGVNAEGLETGSARASTQGWQFVVNVIAIGKQVYRFISAAPTGEPGLEAVAAQVSSSFRRMNDAEKQALRPLRLKIVTVQPGQSIGTLALMMRGSSDPLKLLRVLNNLGPGEIPNPGDRVKIVTDETVVER